jgi:hypothetical protein
MVFTTQGDEMESGEARQYCEHQVVETSEEVFRSLKCISQTMIIEPETIHPIHLGKRKHLMGWVSSFPDHYSWIDKFISLWAIMSPDSGYSQFNIQYCYVTRLSNKEMKN